MDEKVIPGLVNRPQFDNRVLKPGKAVRVKSKDRNDWYGFNYDCLIVNSGPLELTLAYVKERKGHIGDVDETTCYNAVEQKTLPVSLVADGTITITILEEVKGE